MKKRIAAVAVAALAALTVAVSLGAAKTGQRPPAATPSLVEKAIEVNSPGSPFAGQFDVLLCLVTEYPSIVDALSQKGQYTVFAPTDGAFASIGLNEGNCKAFQAANADAVADILLYHVATGRRDAEAVTTSTQIRMLNGDFAAITSSGGNYFIDGAQIIVTDVPASNGIIHAVDGVLLP